MSDQLPYLLRNSDEPLFTYPDLEPPDQDKEIVVSAGLVQLSTGEYQVIFPGVFKPILFGPYYLLLDNQLVQLFQELVPDQIAVKLCSVVRRATGQKWPNYSEIRFRNRLDPESFEDTNCNGLQVFLMAGAYIYVSPDLKKEIEKSTIDCAISICREIPLMAG